MTTKEKLSLLWVFVTANYIFCDVFTLMYHEDLKKLLAGNVDGMVITQGFLLGFAVLMEAGMIMMVLSRLLRHRLNRILNIATGSVLSLAQAATLFAGPVTLHYAFFSVVEVATTLLIVWTALRWSDADA